MDMSMAHPFCPSPSPLEIWVDARSVWLQVEKVVGLVWASWLVAQLGLEFWMEGHSSAS